MRDLEALFAALKRSSFRARFRLNADDRSYLVKHGLAKILEHGREFIQQRLAPAKITNDGRQTPLNGHPIFVAQHATATCCRKCLAKWHHIARGKELNELESRYVLNVLEHWLKYQQPLASKSNNTDRQQTFF
jgi:hypothetical protein